MKAWPISEPGASDAELDADQEVGLFNQLFLDATTHSNAYADPVASITDLIHGAIYLTALRDPANIVKVKGTRADGTTYDYEMDGVAALKYLTGLDLGESGPLVNLAQATPSLTLIKGLFTQLFLDATTHSNAYADPVGGIEDLIHGAIYLTALRDPANIVKVKGTRADGSSYDYEMDGVTALKYLTGLDLPGESGAASGSDASQAELGVDHGLVQPVVLECDDAFERVCGSRGGY